MNASQKRAVATHRRRLAERGLARYEVRGLERDKALLRQLAKQLSDEGATADRLREDLLQHVLGPPRLTGRRIWDALRRSPLVGTDVEFEREVVTPRDIEF